MAELIYIGDYMDILKALTVCITGYDFDDEIEAEKKGKNRETVIQLLERASEAQKEGKVKLGK